MNNNKPHKIIQRFISSLLVALMVLTSLPLTAFADDYNGTGGGSSGGTTGGGLTWSSSKQGYRVTIVDKDGNIVADPVDFVYSEVPSGAEAYYNCKLEGFGVRKTRNARYLIPEIMKSEGFDQSKPLPSAMIWEYIEKLGKEGPIAQGDKVRRWMMKGEFIRGSYPNDGAASGGSSTSGGNSGGNTSKPSTGGNTSGGSSSTSKPPSGNTNGNSSSSGTINLPSGLNDALSSTKLEQYKKEYRGLVSEQAKLYRSYGYNDIEFRSGLNNYVRLVLNPKIDSLKIATSDKQAIKTAILTEYFRQISNGWSSLSAENIITKTIASNLEEIQINGEVEIPDNIVPLASGTDEDAEDGYILTLLNYKVDGQYVFKFKGEDNSASGKGRASIIVDKEYRVMIEPLLWYIPLTKNKTSYGRYVYGTITNQAQWSQYMKSHGFNDSDIWHYSNITRKVGGWSLYLENDEVFTSKTIKSPKANFNKTIATASLADNNNGYAIHIYKASGETQTQTYDPPQGKVEHPAPDPGNIPMKNGERRDINIVKTYQNNGEHVVTYYRTNNPKTIKIMDEPEYKVQEWFISETYNNPDRDTTWDENHAEAPATGATGTKPTTVKVEDPNTTLYVLLVKKDEAELVGEGDLIIRESQITKAVETINPNIPGWGPKVMTFSAADLNGTCGYTWYCGDEDCSGHRCGEPFYLDDTSWSYNHRNTEAIDKYLQADLGNFKAINDRGSDASGTRGSLSETEDNVESFNYKQTLWRGKDIPTLASYKEKSGHELSGLLNRYGKIPQGDRYNGSSYTHPLKITLDMDGSLGDYITTSKHHDGYGKSANHVNINTLNYDATVTVEVYWGKEHQRGDETVTGSLGLPTSLVGKPSQPKYSGGQMLVNGKGISWYPYLRMSYQTTGRQDSDRTNVNVLSQWISELVPNDYVEAAWVSDKEYNLNMRSAQWSLHSKATSGDLGWNKSNRVLPGGAIYSLDTKDNKTWASVVTWQPYLEDEIRNNVIVFGDEYSYGATAEPHDKLVSEATKALENWRVVQHVKNYNQADGKTPDILDKNNTTMALDGLKVSGGGESLSSLGLSGKSNTDDKYYMKPASSNEAANEGDLDIISTQTIEIKYKVTADVEGKIYVYRDRDNSGWVEIDTLQKNQGADSLSGEAMALDQRTKVVTNLCKVLTRNTGNDKTAAWAASDGHWYNEAFDGICYTRRETCFELGFKTPAKRTAALDPALCPANLGQSDLFKRAFISQFFMNDKSDAYQDKKDGFIGSFKGTDVVLAGYKEMFKSMPFSIPNVNVQDLH